MSFQFLHHFRDSIRGRDFHQHVDMVIARVNFVEVPVRKLFLDLIQTLD